MLQRIYSTLLLFFTLLLPASLVAQGHWTGSNNTTSPISRTGLVSIGSTTYNHNSSTARFQLDVDAGECSYGPLYAARAVSKLYNNYGNTSARLGYSYRWSAHRGMVGVFGSTTVNNIYTGYANKDALGLGGYFSASLDNPISNPSSAGSYYAGGMLARLSGTISTYPNNGAVSAVIGLDNIQGSGTYAGYFDGRGYFSGNVGIGVANPSNELEVCGTIRSNAVTVESGWCDYVFENDYRVMPLEEVDAFIAANGHLPKTPSATEIQENGLELASATENQQEKIEEIFLHLIEMNEKIEALEAENKALRAELNQTKSK